MVTPTTTAIAITTTITTAAIRLALPSGEPDADVTVVDAAAPFREVEPAVVLVLKVDADDIGVEVGLASLVLVAAACAFDVVSGTVEYPLVLPVNDERAATLMQDADAQLSQLCWVIWQASP
jgi:hypothetical protein